MSTRTPVQRLLLQQSSSSPLVSHLQSILPQSHLRQQTTTRAFSNTSASYAGVRKAKSFAPQQMGMKQPSQKSFEVMKRDQLKNIDQMPNDLGLIPGTFIMPTASRLPSLTSEFGARFALEKHRAWTRIKEVFA